MDNRQQTTEALFGSQPNILFILSDDHGYSDLSFYDRDEAVHTPNLDRLRNSGMLFEQGFVSAPICSPSRAGLITGSHQQRWGAEWFGNSKFAPEGYAILPEVLQQAGYQTGYFGKVHYGPDVPGGRSCPDQHGFDTSFYGLAAQGMGRLHYMTHVKDAEVVYGEAANRHGMHAMYENGQAVDCHEHLTIEFGKRAKAFMETSIAKEAPYFCMVAFNAVHNFAWQLPQEELDKRNLPVYPDFDPETDTYLDWYDGAISPNLPNGRAYYLAQLELMDQEIGRLLDTLDETGTKEQTIVVYLTDNGGSSCNYGVNAPLTGTKYSLFEGGIRVPYLVSWPSVIPAGKQTNELASSLDLMPTFAYLAGATIVPEVPIDGLNLVPHFTGEGKGHEALYFDTGFQWSVRTKDWKLHEVHSDEDSQNARRIMKEVEHSDIGQGQSLFQLNERVTENPVDNLLMVYPELAAEMTRMYESWVRNIKPKK